MSQIRQLHPERELLVTAGWDHMTAGFFLDITSARPPADGEDERVIYSVGFIPRLGNLYKLLDAVNASDYRWALTDRLILQLVNDKQTDAGSRITNLPDHHDEATEASA